MLVGVQFSPNIPRNYFGDEARIRQVISNLTNNALKFTAHGSVYMTVEALNITTSRATVKISVVDTGIGIAQKDLETVFERFAQVDDPNSNNNEGTGLGLAICKDIVGHMGGKLQLESELGNGSKFSFSLDLAVIKPEQIDSAESSDIIQAA